MAQRQYIAIDLKSFYASVECVERGLHPLDACLVVADQSRTNKTICLAVSPTLKSFGVPGRPRLFEVVRLIQEVNLHRGRAGKSISGKILEVRPDIAVDYVVACPRMQLYMDYSVRIYNIYLRYIAPEDIHVYSVDEVFIDATAYLKTYQLTAHELARKMIQDVLRETGITATVGIGTNMYLCKVAMDILAKKMPADKDGVRIAELDEMSYRRTLWDHRPLRDFWRVGKGIARRLEEAGMMTMGDVARRSINSEGWFYKKFGINAELLIDHAWGWEPVTMEAVKKYRPHAKSLSNGQVLSEPYGCSKAKTVALEMADNVALKLVAHDLATNQIVLTINYDSTNISNPDIARGYHGAIHIDRYGRPVPIHSHGTINFPSHTSSSHQIIEKVSELFDRIVNPALLIRRLTLSINNLLSNQRLESKRRCPVQLQLFINYVELARRIQAEQVAAKKEHSRQIAINHLRKAYGKNVVLRGLNFAEGATQIQRNQQIGGHKA